MSTSQLPLLEPQIHQFKTSRQQSLLSNYDPSAYPPDLEFARNHGKAQKVGHYIPPKQDTDRCPCCLQPINKPKLDMGCQLRQLLHLGCAYPLYLYFIKQCFVLLLINFIICSIPSLIINVTSGNMCTQLHGQMSRFYAFVCQSSVINIMNVTQIDMMEVQAILNFISIMVSIIIIALLDINMRNKYKKYYEDYYILPKASDYSVIIKGLPKDITISEIQELIVQKIKQNGCTDYLVHKIYLIYNLKTYYSLYSNKRQMIQRITVSSKRYQELCKKISQLDGNQPISVRTMLEQQKKQTAQSIGEMQNKRELIQIQINSYEEMFKLMINLITNQQPIDPSAHNNSKSIDKIVPQSQDESAVGIKKFDKAAMKLSFSGKCIVTLNSVESKEALTKNTKNLHFLQKLGYQLGQFLGGSSSSIVIFQAPQPSQIIFSNIGSSKIKRWRQKILVTISLTLVILLDFFLLTIQKKFMKQQKSITRQNLIFSFINAQMIAIFNSIVSRIIRIAQNKTQMHSTQSSYYYSVTVKLVFMYLINMLVTTFFSNLITFYLIDANSQNLDKFPLNFQQYLFDIFFLIVTNPIVSFIVLYFDHRQGLKLYKRYQIQEKGLPVTQAQANLYYQNMQIDLSNKYSYIYRFVIFSAGVCFIYPPSLLICMITIFVMYWQDKYLILHRYVIAHKLNFYLTRRMQNILWLFPLMMAITNVIIMFVPIYDGKAFEQQKYSRAFYYLSCIALVLTLVIYLGGCNWVIAGVERLLKYRKKQQQKIQKMPEYKQIQRDFEQDYWHHYPYFKVKKIEQNQPQSGNLSPRKQKVLQLNKKIGMNVFSVIKNHLHHQRYSPLV